MAAAGAAGLVWPATAHASSFPPPALAYPHLLDVLRDRRLVHELGCRYREIAPTENDADILTRAILPETAAKSARPLRAQVKARVRQDFAHGRTVTLKGWVLAVTEARQCALYSLLQV